MQLLRKHATLALLVSAIAGRTACGAPACTNTPVRVPIMQAAITPTDVQDAGFSAAVGELLVNGQPSPQRVALLAGVERRQFARAVQRFDSSDPTRGLQAVRGALYLIRTGELRHEMLDANSARALDRAYSMAAQRGDEGPALAFLHLRAASLPAGDPEQAAIARRLKSISDWMRDTRDKSAVQNASADAVAYADEAMLEPTPEALDYARTAAERWISASLEFNSTFTPSMRGDRDQMIDAYRGMRTGALTVAGLYLRNGDAAGALGALDAPEVRRITPPSFFTVLQAAASAPESEPWRNLAAVYAKASDDDGEGDVTVPPGVAQGAAWGTLLEAYRRDPSSYEVARMLATVLPQLGMPEASPVVLLAGVQKSKDPRVVSDSLRLVLAAMAQEDAAQDAASAARVYQASQPLLTFADSMRGGALIEPSPASIRLVMGTIFVRAADPADARPLLEQAAAAQPSLEAFSALAEVRFQAGDTQGALDAVAKAVAAPDAKDSPLGVADAWLTAFQVDRSRGDNSAAKEALGSALRQTVAANARATTAGAHAACERMLARIAWYYGDRDAWGRAIKRLAQFASDEPRAQSMALIETASSSLLWGDDRAAKDALQRSSADGVAEEDLVYAALWLQLTERKSGAKESSIVRDTLSAVPSSEPWTAALAAWGLGKIDDQGLMSRARNESQRTEAAFYAAMRRRASGDASADAELARIARGPALDLVETHLSRELTTPAGPGAWGPPPVQFP